MADGPRTHPTGAVLRFGSLDFVATGDGHDTELLPLEANPDSPTPPPRRRRRSSWRARQVRMEWRRAARLSSPTRDEAGVSQPSVVAENVTTSPYSTAATVPPNEGASEPSSLPFGTHTPAATHASSVSPHVGVYEDSPGHHLISIRNHIAPPHDSSYPDSADEGFVFVRMTVRDREAFLAFQAAADYCFACSDDSSEGDYDLTREFFMIKLAEQDDAATNDAENPPANSPVVPPTNSSAPTIATPTNGAQN